MPIESFRTIAIINQTGFLNNKPLFLEISKKTSNFAQNYIHKHNFTFEMAAFIIN